MQTGADRAHRTIHNPRGLVVISFLQIAQHHGLTVAIRQFQKSAAQCHQVLFADQPVEDVNGIAEAAGLDLVQLSGGEDDDFAARISLPVIRAIHVAEGAKPEDILDRATPGTSVGILLDTAVKGARGGSGIAFDWTVAAEAAERLPFMLAGGLTPENVADAVAQVRPWAVDVSSGVETDGVKDIDKVRAFIRAVKGVR